MAFLNHLNGFFFFADYAAYYWIGSAFLTAALGFLGAPLIAWTVLAAFVLLGVGSPIWLLAAFVVVAIIFNLRLIRRTLISRPIMSLMKDFLPKVSETERTALDAGVVWVEGELFSGKPNFQKILNEPYPELTAEERAFVDGPVQKACEMIDDWAMWKSREFPQALWDLFKREKFLGMIIPKEYGGLGFSALAHSEVIMKLSSRSIPACITVMVPNSLGPAELLIHYGTEEQKKFYLPRLAAGEDIPCFGLTEPMAGSDAGAIQAEGIVFKASDGKLCVRLNWNKRWITLAAISTVIGLAFKLRDPDNLLGRGEDLGITCALIPAKTPGVVLGRRHDPMGVPFYNCPTQGHDVVVPVDAIIGGAARAGHGWKMLMECLAAGRGISLPAQSTGGSKLVTRVTTNHATIRKQFGLSIGKFEGIEEPLARIGGYNYLMESFRRFTLGALDKGIKPPVITAIAKYNATEIFRKMITDGMDILGGQGISMGPRNLLAHPHIAVPIGITVEGANILTRTLMIFGQGALRAHPYAYKEVNAVEKNDLAAFDKAFWSHIGHVVRNLFRSVFLSLTRGRLASSPVSGPTAKYYRKLAWTSASFAILADIAMGVLGGKLKLREKITGRFADILSWLYICSAVLRRFEADGRRSEDLPLVHYAMHRGLVEMQKAFDGIFANLPVPGLSWFFKGPIRMWSNLNPLSTEPSDELAHEVVKIIMTDGAQRDRLTDGIFLPRDTNESLGRLEEAFHVLKRAEKIDKKIHIALHERKLTKDKPEKLLAMAVERGIITREEQAELVRAEELRWNAIQVDDFSPEEYHNQGTAPKATRAPVSTPTLRPAGS